MRRIAVVALMLIAAETAYARVGGGESYSGSDSSSSSSSSSSGSSGGSDWSSGSSSGGSSYSGGGGGTTVEVDGSTIVTLFIVFFVMFGVGAVKTRQQSEQILAITHQITRPGLSPPTMADLKEFDPNFSEIVFTDFCYSLFARVHEARGERLDDYAPFVSSSVRDQLRGLPGAGEIVVGSFAVVDFLMGRTEAQAKVEFEANYTEGTRRWYVRERWTLARARDILSPPPEKARAEHCPKCGAALQTRTDGACLHCGTVISGGSFHWFLRSIVSLEKDERPRNLIGGGGPEPGLDRTTVIVGPFAKLAGFSMHAFEQRVRQVANELQTAWSTRDWNRARPYETDALFQTHRYWIDEYLRQGLRNVVEDFTIDNVELAKIATDAFYDAVTVRLYASGNDYTVDEHDNVVSGSMDATRRWSEYWTFIRGRAASAGTRVCPNCGGARAEGQTAICDYCGGKITTGEFPWVLSRIEQDEAYRG